MNKKQGDKCSFLQEKKTVVARERKIDLSKIKIDSSLLLSLLNSAPPLDGSCYKVIESSILRKIFSSVSKCYTNRQYWKNMKVEIRLQQKRRGS